MLVKYQEFDKYRHLGHGWVNYGPRAVFFQRNLRRLFKAIFAAVNIYSAYEKYWKKVLRWTISDLAEYLKYLNRPFVYHVYPAAHLGKRTKLEVTNDAPWLVAFVFV
jgi:hypothetical protein